MLRLTVMVTPLAGIPDAPVAASATLPDMPPDVSAVALIVLPLAGVVTVAVSGAVVSVAGPTLSAIRIPSLRRLTVEVALPVPVLPAVALVAAAAPTDVFVLAASNSSVRAPGEVVVQPLQVPPAAVSDVTPNIRTSAFAVTVVIAFAVTAVFTTLVSLNAPATSIGVVWSTPAYATMPPEPSVEPAANVNVKVAPSVPLARR